MSAFEVSVTPTRLKNAKKKNEAREPTLVIMAPFSSKSVVIFGDIPVTKTARRFLHICNPSQEEIKVMVTKGFKPEMNVSLDWTSNLIAAGADVQLEIVWNPLKAITCKETIQLTDNRNFRKDITVIMKSINNKFPNKTVKRFPTITNTAAPVTTLKLKSPSPRSRQSTQRIVKRTSSSQNFEKISQSTVTTTHMSVVTSYTEKISPLFENNKIIPRFSPEKSSLHTVNQGKENESPVSPTNASALFDKILFTPATESKDKGTSHLDYLASLPTPISRTSTAMSPPVNKFQKRGQPRRLSVIPSPDENDSSSNSYSSSMLSKLSGKPASPRIGTPIKRKSPRISPKILIQSSTPPSIGKPKQFEPRIYSTIEKQLTPDRTVKIATTLNKPIDETDSIERRRKCFDSQTQINNKTFDVICIKKEVVDDILELSPEIIHTSSEPAISMNRTATLLPACNARPLSMIEEEERSGGDVFLQNTFKMEPHSTDEKLMHDIMLVGTPLRKHSESMRDISANKSRSTTYIQGSMPNLNNMERIESIAQNRYYYKQVTEYEDLDMSQVSDISLISVASTMSTASAQDVLFNQSEIRAQSSRYNIHEIGVAKNTRSSPKMTGTNRVGKKINTPQRSQNDMRNIKRQREPSIDSPTSKKYLNVQSSTCTGFTMTVSPPKRTRFDSSDSSTSTRPGTEILAKNWSRTQPKKLRIQKTLTLLKKPITPRKVKAEPRVMLYDSDLFLQPYINPDPFAATTTCDPFLASTMYLDERSVHKHETQFKKWLNALVAAPAEFDSDCNQKIDVGRLFNEVRNKELTLAPTKEEHSMNYLTKSRMDALRKAAVTLFMSEEMRTPCSKVAVHINKHSLKIRNDRDLHLDVVMQRYILELLLCFNPLWLRIGLEVVFGEIIYLQSNADVVGLSTFILNRLFRDKFIEQKYSRAYVLTEEYAEKIKKFTLQKFLFLLLFLDKAKNNRIIKHNPCLFIKKSQYKETKDILIRFAAELLANIGDVTRNLKRMGYVLTHKQTFLDEFDFAFKNLAVDLRDGIRLTHVLEIILLRDDMSKQLRVPAISRLQRIFNVNLGLKALAETDFVLTGDISAADIVDGHREKTLSLLWQIIYKFRSPKFIAAATVLQRWWRYIWLRVIIQRRIKVKIEIKRNYSATVIQSAYRSYVSRKYVKLFKFERILAVTCLQKYVRRYLVRKRYEKTHRSIIYIQRWYRTSNETLELRNKFLSLKQNAKKIQKWYRRIILARKLEQTAPLIREIKSTAKLHYEKAVIIQKTFKSYTIRRKFQKIITGIVNFNRKKKIKNVSASRIQSFFQMVSLRKSFLIKRQAAYTIQQTWRTYMTMKTIRVEYLLKRHATIKIQTYFRSYLVMKCERYNYLEIKSSTINIQRRYRAKKLAELQRAEYLDTKLKVIKIQKYFRAKKEMKKALVEYTKLRETVIMIQRRFRANKKASLQIAEYRNIKSAAITIQTKYRATLLMRKELSHYKLLKMNTIKIQQKFRATLLTRKVRLDFLSLQYHTTLIQQQFRANCLMRKQRMEFLKLKTATIKIQRMFRANELMKKTRDNFICLKKSTILIQRRYRAYISMRISRARFIGTREAVLCIQQHFRQYLLMRNDREIFLSKKNSAIIIQQRLRAYWLRKDCRTKYLKIQSATLLIQRKYRAYRAMKENRADFIKKRTAVITIQQQYRAFVLGRTNRAEFLKIQKSIIVLQRRYKALRSMRYEKTKYNNIRNAAILIQHQVTAYQAMKVDRAKYLALQKATIILQTHFKANLMRNYERHNYIEIRKATITIQRHWRAYKSMTTIKCEYQKIIKSTVCIQQHYRAYMKMKQTHAEYVLKRNACIYIQRWYKAQCSRRKQFNEYKRIKHAVEIFQTRYRALREMRKAKSRFEILVKSTICIQQRYRAYIQMKNTKEEYCAKRTASIVIQRWYTANRLGRIQYNEYKRIQHAATVLQTRFRALLDMRKAKSSYNNLIQATICIQQKFRANKLMRIQRTEYIQICQSTKTIQFWYRAIQQGKKVRCEFNALKQATISIQRQFRAQRAMRITYTQYTEYRVTVIVIQRYIRSFILMRRERKHFLIQKQAAITIQQKLRATLLMRTERFFYQRIVKSVTCIQTRLRATYQMRIERQRYLHIRQQTIRIQVTFRSYILMREQRQSYLFLKHSTVAIQRRFRANREMLKIKNQYMLIRSVVIYIQRKYRAKLQGRIDRTRFLQIKTTAIFIQQKYRGQFLTEIARQNFLIARSVASGLQARIRGYLARKRFHEMMTPEMREHIKRNKAAKVIQRIWRGHCVRKRQPGSKLRRIRAKIQELRLTSKPCNSMRNKLKSSVKLLKGRYNVQESLGVLIRLENISRILPHMFMDDTKFIAAFCYAIMAQAIRSECDKIVIELCSRIILNLARYEDTQMDTFIESGFATIAQMLLRWCDKDCPIFNTLCTLVWVFSHNSEKMQKIRDFMTTREAIYTVRETKKLVLRKEKMRQNVRKVVAYNKQPQPVNFQRTYPSLEPDYGVIKNKPYIFYSSVFAFDSVLSKLGIDIK